MQFVLKRTEQFLDILKKSIIQNPIQITDVEISDSRDGSTGFVPFKEGGYWGKNDSWYRFKAALIIPEEYEGKHVKCMLKTGRENLWVGLNPQFLVRVNGKVIQALDTNHHDFEISSCAVPGEKFELDLEAYSGRDDKNPAAFIDSPLQFILSMFCHCSLSEKLFYDLKAAKMAAEIYPETDYNRIQIENHLTNALNLLDCRLPNSKEYFDSLKVASDYMQAEFYEKFCGNSTVIADVIGHTHIDVAWLWQLEQTRAKAVRSFSTELALMKEYPEHLFVSSQPQLYQFVKEDCPEVYEQIKERVKEGRWEVEGAMWLEADCNLSSGESLIRQIVQGKRFIKDEFNVESKTLWLPDVFGYSAAIPQILKKTDVDTFVTSKIHWNDTNHFPYDTFIWKGIDGSEVFTQYITAAEPKAVLGSDDKYSTYNAMVYPIAVAKGWEIYQNKDINNEILVSFGYGDGGGGVTREMLEMQRRLSYGIPGTPKTKLSKTGDTLANIKKNTKGKNIPKWFGELYLEFHRGTYTSQALNKKYNRQSEFLLQSTEAASLANKVLNGGKYEKKEIYDSWTTVLLNQFHDIIPGSSINGVYKDSHKQYEALLAENTDRFNCALKELAGSVNKKGVFVYNPAGVEQTAVVECEGKKYLAENVPAFGYTVLDENDFATNESTLVATTSHLENAFYSIDLDEKGQIVSIFDKENQREVVKKGEKANVLEAFDDHPFVYDNWELSVYHKEKMWVIDDLESIEVCDVNELSASLKIKRKFLNSTFEQTITIYRDSRKIDFDTTADWHEHHIFVKVAFPVEILSDKATYEIQYGAVERPAHTNTSWDKAKFEVCAHKWADFAEADYGVALMNNCKYGHDIHDGVMRLSLIKCGTYPDPEADQGEHKFIYSLMPHGKTWREAEVANVAYALNNPLKVLKSNGTGSLNDKFSFASCNKSNIIITVAKEADQSEDIVIRAYEATGVRTNAGFTLGFDFSDVDEVNMLENKVIGEVSKLENGFSTQFMPFEIKTFKISK